MKTDNQQDTSPALGRSLAEAIGYVAAWRGRTVVIKIGGRSLDEADSTTLLDDVALLHRSGVRVMVVHGGGAEVSRQFERLGISPRFEQGLRVTDEESIEVVEAVLAGTVNKRLVRSLARRGCPAVGLCGQDGGLFRAALHPKSATLGRVGVVAEVSGSVIETLLNEPRFVPVVASIGLGEDGGPLNLNADTAAAALAAGVAAEKLLFLTDVEGVMNEAGERISRVDVSEARQLIASEQISGGMIPKVEACFAALAGGVNRTHILSAVEPHAILVELFTERGVGTLIANDHRQRSLHFVNSTSSPDLNTVLQGERA